jgi:hypothetical protein
MVVANCTYRDKAGHTPIHCTTDQGIQKGLGALEG